VFRIRKVFVVCIISFFITNVQADRGDELDSLNTLLSETHDIEKKIEIYTSLSKLYQLIDLENAREMADRALTLSRNTDTDAHLGEIFGCLGDIAVIQDSIEPARAYYETALGFFENSEDIRGLVGVTVVLGNIAFMQDDLADAMQYYMRSINHAKESGLEKWLPSLNLNIGSINSKAGYYNEALTYFLKSLESLQNTNDSLNIAQAFANIGMVYIELNELDLSSQYLDKALNIYLKTGIDIKAAWVYADLARIDQIHGDHNSAVENLSVSLKIILNQSDYAGPKSEILSMVYNRFGESYLKLHENKKAEQYFKMAYKIGILNGQASTITNAAKGISDFWDKQGNSDSALHYYRIYKAYSDSVSNEDNIRKLAYQDARFKYGQQLIAEKQKREQEAEKQDRNMLLLVFIIVLLVMLLVVSVLFLKLGRNKVKRIELEQQTLKKELELRNKELATHVIYQVKNNEFILNVSKKLKNALSIIIPENRPLINEVIKEIEFDSSQDAWKEFEVRFQRVHSGFNRKLATDFPDLSANDLRLSSFLRLNLNTKDIAAITYQSTNSIDVARSRLRQKLGLDKDESLVTFLSQY